MPKSKVQARSSRVAVDNLSFGQTSGFGRFGTGTSVLSYLAEFPDTSSISNPQIVVVFKNLAKKDGITKARALEELQNTLSDLVTSKGDLDDAIISVWTGAYPKTSIDSSKRVRQLSHVVQKLICLSVGKRIAKSLPQLIGPWLLGLYDNDKVVSNAAQTGLSEVFNTQEKRSTLRKAYQEQLLELCKTILIEETPGTLSDERVVSPDEANVKYYRTVSAALGLINDVTHSVSEDDLDKFSDKYEGLILDSKFWNSATISDSATRRAFHRFLSGCLEISKLSQQLDIGILSSRYVEKGLEADQKGSATDFLNALIQLTQFNSTVWTEGWRGKKEAHVRLRHFISNGTQGSLPIFWSKLTTLLSLIPKLTFPDNEEGAEKFISAYHKGLTRKDEPKTYLINGIKEMLTATLQILSQLSPEQHQKCLAMIILPLLHSYITPSEDSQWSISGPRSSEILSAVAKVDGALPIVVQDWPAVSDKLINEIKLSLPEKSSGFQVSQDKIEAHAQRWCQIAAMLINTEDETVVESILKVLQESITLSISRNGKPYGATAAIDSILKSCHKLFKVDAPGYAILQPFVKDKLPVIFLSPSLKHLSSILQSSQALPFFRSSWESCLEIVTQGDSSENLKAFTQLLLALQKDGFTFSENSKNTIIGFMEVHLRNSLTSKETWALASAVLTSIIDDDILEKLFQLMSSPIMTPSENTQPAISGFLHLSRTNPLELYSLLAGAKAESLVTQLLLLTESTNEELSKAAEELKAVILAAANKGNLSKAEQETSMINVIQKNLAEAGPNTILVSTLVAEAVALLKAKGAEVLSSLLPPTESWRENLKLMMGNCPPTALSISSPFRNGIFLVDNSKEVLGQTVDQDITGLSISMRQALYTIGLFNAVEDVTLIETSRMSTIVELLTTTTVLANENISIVDSTQLYSAKDPHTVQSAIDFVSDSQHLLKSWLEKSEDWWLNPELTSSYGFVQAACNNLFQKSIDSSPESYHSAVAYNLLVSQLVEIYPLSEERSSHLSSDIMNLRKSKNSPFSTCAFLLSHSNYLPDISVASRWYNEMIADLSGPTLGDDALRRLCILYVVMDPDGSLMSTTSDYRWLGFVRQLVKWLDTAVSDMEHPQIPVICGVLAVLSKMPSSVTQAYGDHWETMIESCIKILSFEIPKSSLGTSGDQGISLLYETLQFYRSLLSLTKQEDCNEDLIEALQSSEKKFYTALLGLIPVERAASDETSQPLRMVNDLIQRMLTKIPASVDIDTSILYPIMSSASKSESLQLCAFQLLHSTIPKLQEQISVDLVLEKSTARLPDELLSLILDPPKLDANSLEDASDATLLSLKGYLLSWLLVFDHFTNASHLLKDQYVECLKDGDYLSPLLNLISTMLKLGSNKPTSRSNLAISFYEPNDFDEPQEQVINLATHLYYLSLIHLSSLSRAWFVDIRSRGLSQGVEAWTEKYISPRVIETDLKAVQQSDPADDGKTLIIKAYIPLGEIIASYTIATVEVADPNNARGIVDTEFDVAICVKLPKAFPLRTVEVKSVTARSTFDERRWTAWLRTCQGIISHRNDGLVDGLLSWKRNVVGAVQGKSECTICYSLVAEDGKLPSKKCKTCKNSFHVWCLNKWFASSGDRKCPLCRSEFGDMGRKG